MHAMRKHSIRDVYKRQAHSCPTTAINPDATQAEREKAAKVFTDMEAVSYTHLTANLKSMDLNINSSNHSL